MPNLLNIDLDDKSFPLLLCPILRHLRNAQIVDLWMDALAAERGVVSGAIEQYRASANDYLAWLWQGVLAEVRTDTIPEYLGTLDAKHYSENTIALRRSVVSGLHKFIRAEG